MAKTHSKPSQPAQHVNKSAITGRFVTEQYAKTHTATTFKETIHKQPNHHTKKK